MKSSHTGVKRILFAAKYSCQGLYSAWKHEAAIRQEVILLISLTLISFFLPINRLEQLALIGSLVLVVIVELLNSAIEAVVDRVGDEWHELSGRAKDIGSAAVFIALGFSIVTWLCVLL